MTFFQKINIFRRQIQLELFPQTRPSVLNFYAALPIEGKPNLRTGTAAVRLLEKGIPVKDFLFNLKRESDFIFNDQKLELPLVSCLLVTKNRFELATKAVQCFINQSYPNRELIVIDDGTDDRLEEQTAALANPKIRFFRLPNKFKKLGVLRNLSREYAKGKYLAQWDDDDVSHPDRLLYQMTLILKYQLVGCTLQREELWFPANRFFGWSKRRLWEGAMIAAKEELPLYHETRLAEESDAVNAVALNGRIALLDFPQLYTYCFHGKNTFDEPHFEQTHRQASRIFSEADYEHRTKTLSFLGKNE